MAKNDHHYDRSTPRTDRPRLMNRLDDEGAVDRIAEGSRASDREGGREGERDAGFESLRRGQGSEDVAGHRMMREERAVLDRPDREDRETFVSGGGGGAAGDARRDLSSGSGASQGRGEHRGSAQRGEHRQSADLDDSSPDLGLGGYGQDRGQSGGRQRPDDLVQVGDRSGQGRSGGQRSTGEHRSGGVQIGASGGQGQRSGDPGQRSTGEHRTGGSAGDQGEGLSRSTGPRSPGPMNAGQDRRRDDVVQGGRTAEAAGNAIKDDFVRPGGELKGPVIKEGRKSQRHETQAHHVQKHQAGWAVFSEQWTEPSEVFESRDAAIRKGEDMAKSAGGELIVHDDDGRVERVQKYGNPPNRQA